MPESYCYTDAYVDGLCIAPFAGAASVRLRTGDGVAIPACDLPEVIEALARAAGVDLTRCLLVPDGGDMSVHQPVDDGDDVRAHHLGPWSDEIEEDGAGATLADAIRAVLGGNRG